MSFYFVKASKMHFDNFITHLNTTPIGRAAIHPTGNRNHEYINAGGSRVRKDPFGI
jgi:hypothetical protein